MQTKGKKKIIDNAGALQKKYTWKSEKQKKKPAAACPYAKKCGGFRGKVAVRKYAVFINCSSAVS